MCSMKTGVTMRGNSFPGKTGLNLAGSLSLCDFFIERFDFIQH